MKKTCKEENIEKGQTKNCTLTKIKILSFPSMNFLKKPIFFQGSIRKIQHRDFSFSYIFKL